ncbi:unnamed protein product [Cyprideis torosa]|uniref:phosphatidate phosphatase n=1 Tax=Cyprideis torosa TaxID=163714 RepID=A0A7R8W0V4_9CRUS|nr:unnamed protein product [Cyprideis torosa]CAG0880000.1 unnamed protein product [Cyprideis torosa]
MNYFGKFLNNFKEFYSELNTATLTGAIDVVVVRQPDGSYTCSPFHVRFGKLGVLKAREKCVDIEVNGCPVDIHMKLGETGEAFFLQENREEEEPFEGYHLSTVGPESSVNTSIDEEGHQNAIKSILPTALSAPEGLFELAAFDSGNKEHMEQVDELNEDFNEEERDDSGAIMIGRSISFPAETTSEESLLGRGNSEETPRRKTTSVSSDSVASSATQTPPSISLLSYPEALKDLPFERTLSPSAGTSGRAQRKRRRAKKGRKKSTSSSDSEVPVLSPEETVVTEEPVEEDELETRHDGGETSPGNIDSGCVSQEEKDDVRTAAEVLMAEERKVPVRGNSVDYHPFSDTDFSPMSSPLGSRPGTPVKSDTEYEMDLQRTERGAQTDAGGINWAWGQLPEIPKRKGSVPIEEANTGSETSKAADTKITIDEPAKETTAPQVANEYKGTSEEERSMLGGIFSFMRRTKKLRHQPEAGGIYLNDLDLNQLDPQTAALYFPPSQLKLKFSNTCTATAAPENQGLSAVDGETRRSSVETNRSSSSSWSKRFDVPDLAISLCGDFEALTSPTAELQKQLFLQSQITFDDFVENTDAILSSPDLMFRMNGIYYKQAEAVPRLLSLLLYDRPYPGQPKPGPGEKSEVPLSTRSSWFSWTSSAEPSRKDGGSDVVAETSFPETEEFMTPSEGPHSEPQFSAVVTQTSTEALTVKCEAGSDQTVPMETDQTHQETLDLMITISPKATVVSDSELSSMQPRSAPLRLTQSDTDQIVGPLPRTASLADIKSAWGVLESGDLEKRTPRDASGKKYVKSLRLTSDQIKELNLLEGPNEAVFSVTTAYQGTTRCWCNIFLWDYTDKIIVSDIDGTITKSDVLGHILPIIGRDWSQSDVAQLFTKISRNGYRFLYLSARAIGQAHITREYLRSIRQGDVCLPNGPLLLNPASLISAFHREVIVKKPEEFKISCLRDIQALFSVGREDLNPFYAGYGNRVNDVWAYRAVGIPIHRIFTINPKGEIRHELTRTFQTSYGGQAYMVDCIFPPIIKDSVGRKAYTGGQYADCQYWRTPVPELSDEEESKSSVLTPSGSPSRMRTKSEPYQR